MTLIKLNFLLYAENVGANERGDLTRGKQWPCSAEKAALQLLQNS